MAGLGEEPRDLRARAFRPSSQPKRFRAAASPRRRRPSFPFLLNSEMGPSSLSSSSSRHYDDNPEVYGMDSSSHAKASSPLFNHLPLLYFAFIVCIGRIWCARLCLLVGTTSRDHKPPAGEMLHHLSCHKMSISRGPFL